MSPVAQDAVTVRVPASTSNCGAGFDTLGLAFDIHNHITLTRMAGAEASPVRTEDGRAQAMVVAASGAFFKAVNRTPFGFGYRIEGVVPPARGLGSSAIIRAGVVAGLDALAGTGLDRSRIVALVTALEGHPDNATACVLGGFCVPRTHPADGTYIDTIRFEVPADLAFVAMSPLLDITTKESRGTLPAKIPYFDAVRSINSAAYLVAVFATRDYERLRHAVGDFMHEPYRLPKIPGAQAALSAGVAAGALTGWLSGSGSSVLCVTRHEQAETVLGAMRGSFTQAGLPCEGRIMRADNSGLGLV
jgi:homoserine kinase